MTSHRVEPWEDPDPLKPLNSELSEDESRDDAPPAEFAGGSRFQRRGSRLRLKSVALGILFGVLVAGIGWLVAIVLLSRDSLPLLTAADFAGAKEHWRERRPASYDLDLAVHVMLEGKIHVEVRQHSVTVMTRDGIATPPHTWDYWSVDGLLGVIGEDLRNNEDAIKASGGNSLAAPIVQQAKFDPFNGLPLHYRRSQSIGGLAGAWEITSFQPVDSK